MAKTYDKEGAYVLESDFGCYSDYGWSLASSHDHFCDAEAAYNHWVGTGDRYRVVDNLTGEVVLGDDD